MSRFLRTSLLQSLKRPTHPLRTRPGPVLTTLSLSFVGGGTALALNTSSNNTDPLEKPPLSSLLRAYLVFSLCSLPSLVDASPHILSFLSYIPVLRQISDVFLKVTFFNQFVGAEAVDACIPLLHTLRKSNQGTLLSYSVEQHDSSNPNDPSQQALQSILHSIDIAADFEDGLPSTTSATWVAVKLSTLLPDPSSLRLLSSWIIHHNHHPISNNKLPIPFPGAPNAHHLHLFLQSPQHVRSLRTLHTNLRKICTRARSRGIRLTIDAEETWFQPAIDVFSILLMQEFNSSQKSTQTTIQSTTTQTPQPLVYTTLQAYLTRTPTFLNFLINHAKENDYSLGVKLVRGAYIDVELDAHAHRDRSQALSISPDERPPTFPDKVSTNEAYDKCVRVLVKEVARDVEKETPGIGVLFGTHNWKSSRLVLDEIVRVGLGKQVDERILLSEQVRKRVCMAQLYGMSDSLAAYLVDLTSHPDQTPSSPFVIRYVPYGPLRDVMPYLARRAVENRSVLGSSGVDLMSGNDQDREREIGGGGAVEERKRFGRLIRERVVGFWG